MRDGRGDLLRYLRKGKENRQTTPTQPDREMV